MVGMSVNFLWPWYNHHKQAHNNAGKDCWDQLHNENIGMFSDFLINKMSVYFDRGNCKITIDYMIRIV